MKYTTKNYRIDSTRRIIEIYRDTNFIEFYKVLIRCWSEYMGFYAIPFPNPITEMFPVTLETKLLANTVIKW